MSRAKGSKNIPNRLHYRFESHGQSVGYITRGIDVAVCRIETRYAAAPIGRLIVDALNLAHKVAKDKRTARAGNPTGGRKPRLHQQEQGK